MVIIKVGEDGEKKYSATAGIGGTKTVYRADER